MEPVERNKLNREAQHLLDFMASLDDMWAERIKIVREERGLDALQTLGSLASRCLDAAEHMMVSSHPFFEKSE